MRQNPDISTNVDKLVIVLGSLFGALTIFLATLSGTDTKDKQSVQSPPHYLKDAKRNLVYFQDEKTGICFAFTSASDSTSVIGGLATVDCQKVPSDLLK